MKIKKWFKTYLEQTFLKRVFKIYFVIMNEYEWEIVKQFDASLRRIKCLHVRGESAWETAEIGMKITCFFDRTTLLTSMFDAIFTEKPAAIIDIYCYSLIIAYCMLHFIHCVPFSLKFISTANGNFLIIKDHLGLE